MLWPTRAAAVLAVAASGCSPASTVIDAAAHGYTATAAEAFQLAADKHLADPVSPLTAVNAYYLLAGEMFTVRAMDRAHEPPGPIPDYVEIELRDSGAIEVRRFVAGEMAQQIKGPGQLKMGLRMVVVSEQSGGARVVIHDPAAAARTAFDRRPWFPVDAGAIVAGRRRGSAKPRTQTLRTSRGLDKEMTVAGILEGQLHDTPFSLTAFGSPTGDWLVPFIDPSNGETSYPAGRYLTVPPDAREGDAVVLDFNRAVNPWCAYSEHYNCPIPPTNSVVAVAVLAGERFDEAH